MLGMFTRLAYEESVITHNENCHKAGRDDDPVSIAHVCCLPHQHAVEYEVPQPKFETTS